MFAVETVFLGLIMLVVGAIIGAIAARTWIPPVQQKELQQRLSSAQAELDVYQQDVAKHFMETSKQVEELTESYRNLHEHLSKGALQLASNEIGRELIAAGERPISADRLEQTPVEPPKDWAPRVPGSHGMLSEEFGLKEHDAPDEPGPKLNAEKS